MDARPRGTLTFLFTDIEGSTRLLRQLRDRYNAVLADHRRLLRSAFQRHGGEEIGTEGDSFFVVFRSARDAVAAAAEGQRALVAHEWPDETPILVRMGMNTGEPTVDEDGSYVGLGVHLAARIASAGHGGQILLSQATCALLHSDEAALDVEVSDLGEHWLKDFERPERIFQVVGDGLPSAFPALKTLDKQAVDATAREGGLPYKGLEAFQPQDAEFFFGREELVESLAGRLVDAGFLAVVGPSGSGKSSVVRAGLIPAIWRGAAGISDGRDWRVVLLTPGAEPLDELAVHLAAEQGVSAGSLLADLRADPGNLCLATRQSMLDRPAGANVALVVDQFEEVFTLCRREDDRRAFVDALVRTAESDTSRAVVVLSLRADFYGHCAGYPELAALLERSQALVGPMRERELRRAIERPAAAAGVELEPGLADEILADLGDAPGNLPLLSHALLETWKRKTGRRLAISDYRDAGGVREAIARTADAVYAGLSSEEKEIARRVFLRLAEPGQGTEDTRRRAAIEELLPEGDEGVAVEAVLETLARERLITIGQGTVEVAHEALIREWPQFRRWLDEDREGLQVHRRLTEEAREWDRLRRDASVLYRGARLHAAREWAEGRDADLSALERAFLDACGEAEQSELDAARRRNRRLRMLAAALAALLVLAIAGAVLALVQTGRAEQQRRLATSRGLVQAATAQLDERVDLALLLALEAHDADATFETRNTLLRASQRARRIVQFLPAPGAALRDVAVSADGRTIATVGTDGVRVWDARTRRPLTAAGAGPGYTVVAYAPDGRLATDAGGSGIVLWDARAGRRVRTIASAEVTDLAFAPDNETLAAATGEGLVLFGADGTPRGPALTRGGDPALRVAFSPDGSVVAASSLDGTITLWDTRRRAPTGPVLRADGVVEALAFSADGQTLVTSGDELLLWNLRQRQPAPQRIAPEAETAAVSATGMIAAGFSDGTIRLSRLGDDTVEILRGHHDRVNALAFGPGGRMLVSAGEDGNAIVWTATRDARALRIRDAGADAAVAVAFTLDGTRVAAAAASDVHVWTTRGRSVTRLAIGAPVLDVAIGAGTLAVATAGGVVATSNLRGPSSIRRSELGAAPVAAVAAAGTRFAAASERVVVWTTGDRRFRPLVSSTNAQDVAYTPDGATLGVAAPEGVRFYDGESGKPRDDLRIDSTTPIRRLAFSDDGNVVGLAGEDIDIELVNLRDGTSAGALVSGEPVGSIAFSPDGNLAAAGTVTGSVVIWDVETRLQLGEPLPGHTRAVLDVGFDPDERMLVSAGSDGAVLLHDISTWSDEDALIERACSIVGRNLTRAEWSTFLPGEEYSRTCEEWPEPAT